MKKLLLFILVLVSVSDASSQNLQRPRIVVGIVVDQMRWDYLYRFYNRYGNGGFKRLLHEGFSCENTFIPYTPTSTAPGHACIYTGSVPALHGIMGNSWYDRQRKKMVYCTEDTSVTGVGSHSDEGKMSTRNLHATTITDELRLATNFTNKTISIAIKDRASILPGGHSANGSYWFDNATGGLITSSFYMQQLPAWVQRFNARKLPDQYLKQDWHTLYPIETYKQSTADSNAFEGRLPGEDRSFPHITSTITNNKYETFRYTPHGNTFTIEAARAAIEGELLGQRNVTDFLAISFSSPDLIGHTFGPNSIEMEDNYLRLDRDLAGFLSYLDNKFGKGQYLVFLTSDHAAAHNPGFLKHNRIAAGTHDNNTMKRLLNDSLKQRFQVDHLIENASNHQFYLNDELIARQGLDRNEIKRFVRDFILRQPGVAYVADLSELHNSTMQNKLKTILTNSYNPKLSGDLQVVYKPAWNENWRTGTSHSVWNPYDSHIPLIWFGWKIKPGKTTREVYMTDIAPTLAALLKVQMPNASVGEVIEEIVK